MRSAHKRDSHKRTRESNRVVKAYGKATIRTVFVLCALALVASGCRGDGSAKPSPAATESIPTVSIGPCQIRQGDREPARAKGTDYRTQLAKRGVLRVGSSFGSPPFGRIDPDTKKPAGFEVDLSAEIAKRLGLKVEPVTTSVDRLVKRSIPRGDLDVGIGEVPIEEARARVIDFTIPYFQADLALVVNVEKTPDVKSIDDLRDRIVGAQERTAAEVCAGFLVQLAGVREVKPSDAPLQDLLAGKVNVVVSDHPASQSFVSENPALRIVQVIETRKQYGMVVSKKKPDLRVAIDGALTTMMNDGSYAGIYERWFGARPPFRVPLR